MDGNYIGDVPWSMRFPTNGPVQIEYFRPIGFVEARWGFRFIGNYKNIMTDVFMVFSGIFGNVFDLGFL